VSNDEARRCAITVRSDTPEVFQARRTAGHPSDDTISTIRGNPDRLHVTSLVDMPVASKPDRCVATLSNP
jgi:hypothetical protein